MFATTQWVLLGITIFACALSVGTGFKSYSIAMSIRSLRSLQSEISEIDACVGSLITTIRRIEGRQTAKMKREPLDESVSTTTSLSLMDKDQLRRYAGLLPGKPARHENGNNDRDSA